MNKTRIPILFSSILLVAVSLLMVGCSQDDGNNPSNLEINTLEIFDVTENSAECKSEMRFKSDQLYVNRAAVCWSTEPGPTPDDMSFGDRQEEGVFYAYLGSLVANTTYYVRAYANIEGEIVYGNELNFTTLDVVVPCSPEENTVFFLSSKQRLKNIVARQETNISGFYVLEGTTPFNEFTISFEKPPVSGVYEDVGVLGFVEGQGCFMEALFGGYYYWAQDEPSVYVIKNGENQYEVSFCDVELASGSTGISFTTDGNITSK